MHSTVTTIKTGFPSKDISVADSWASQVVLVVKNSPANEGTPRDVGSIPG